MNAQVHFWIVTDAVRYIRDHGDDQTKRALQALENAYGQGAPIGDIQAGKTAVEYLAGFEAWHTDKFGDLSLKLAEGPWGAKGDITGMAGHLFTAFNHFVNPYPYEEHPWVVSGGYSYGESSRKGIDSFVMRGISEGLRGRLDQEGTLVFDRVKSGWKLGPKEWKENLNASLEELVFAPWTVLGPYYYDRLLFHHFEPLKVRGPNESIVGLQLLGPVFHAATDCCSMQHVRPAMGYQHQVWENYTQSMAFLGKINMVPEQVSDMLSRKPFNERPRASSGPREGLLDSEQFLRRISLATASMLSESMGQGWGGIWDKNDQGWKDYLSGPTIVRDTERLYNQAVAATTILIRVCFQDLEKLEILGPDGEFRQPGGRPDLELEQDKFDQWPPTNSQGVNPENQRENYLLRVAGDLEHDKKITTELADLLNRIEGLALSSRNRASRPAGLTESLAELETLLMGVYSRKAADRGEGFCPITLDEKIPIDSDMSAHFGTSTYRLPSAHECENSEALKGYMEAVEAHGYFSSLVHLTQAVAAMEFNGQRLESNPETQKEAMASINRLRDLRDGKLEADGGIPEEVRSEQSPRTVKEQGGGVMSLFEKITDFFNVPKLAMATVAAAALILVMVMPRGGPETQYGISSVDWEKPAFSLMGPPKRYAKAPPKKGPRPKLALVILFEDVAQAKEQKVIDSYYRNLEPTPRMESQYRVIPPYKLKQAVEKGDISLDSKEAFQQGLRRELNASAALFATVRGRGGDRYTVQSRLVNLEDGKTARKSKEKTAIGFEAASKLRETATGLFEGD
jgi:hypothetical protein